MSRSGQPLHFLGWVLGGWVAARAGMIALPLLWSEAPFPEMPDPVSPETGPITERRRSGRLSVARAAVPAKRAVQLPVRVIPNTPMPLAQLPRKQPERSAAPIAMPAVETASALAPASRAPISIAQRLPSRWSATAWVLWRPDGLGGLAQGPLLGGSQMGARIDYRLLGTAERGLAFYGRASRAMARPFAEEVALGLALRPVRGLPVSLLAERRIALGKGGRDGFALLAAGGIGPRPIARRLELEGYAQAGMVGLPGADGFVDGRLSLDYRLSRPSAAPDIALGMSLNTSAQPGASRLDIGPQLRLRLPVDGGHLRLSAEWRERVAGDARPARGPALTLVADF